MPHPHTIIPTFFQNISGKVLQAASVVNSSRFTSLGFCLPASHCCGQDFGMGVKNLALRGVALSEPPSASSSGSVIAFLDAPEGYEIELIQAGKTDG